MEHGAFIRDGDVIRSLLSAITFLGWAIVRRTPGGGNLVVHRVVARGATDVSIQGIMTGLL